MEGETEPLVFVELRFRPSVHTPDGSGETAVRPLEAHKKEAVVPRRFQVPERIHFPAHGLGFQPDFIVPAAFHQDRITAEIPEIPAAFFFRGVPYAHQPVILRAENNVRFRQHPGGPPFPAKTGFQP